MKAVYSSFPRPSRSPDAGSEYRKKRTPSFWSKCKPHFSFEEHSKIQHLSWQFLLDYIIIVYRGAGKSSTTTMTTLFKSNRCLTNTNGEWRCSKHGVKDFSKTNFAKSSEKRIMNCLCKTHKNHLKRQVSELTEWWFDLLNLLLQPAIILERYQFMQQEKPSLDSLLAIDGLQSKADAYSSRDDSQKSLKTKTSDIVFPLRKGLSSQQRQSRITEPANTIDKRSSIASFRRDPENISHAAKFYYVSPHSMIEIASLSPASQIDVSRIRTQQILIHTSITR